MRKLFSAMTMLLLVQVPTLASAALTIDITEGVEGAVPIAIVPFDWRGASKNPPLKVTDVVQADLRRSGRFAPIPEADLLARPHEGNQVNFTNWRTLGVDHLVVGKMQQVNRTTFQVQFQLMDVIKGVQLTGYSLQANEKDLRKLAHQISDIVYETITGERGAFDTHLAYVTLSKDKAGKNEYRLAVSDADGYNEKIILKSSEPIMSPSWSPDGKQLAYVSFSRGRPELYVQTLATSATTRIAEFKGLNNAPAWSPDGKKLAMTLSKDGNPEIYIMDLSTRKLNRITRNYAIDTEPAWMPDGTELIFTSDRGRQPQLYRVRIDANGPKGRPERLTYDGDYNSRATVSPDGTKVAMVHRSEGRYRIAVMDLENNILTILTDARLDESPSFAPNGSMIIYATEYNRRGVLAAVSVAGRAQQRLSFQKGDVREPAWSPFKNN